MARENADWLVKQDLLARTVTIKVRYSDFTTITRVPLGRPDQGSGRDSSAARSSSLTKTAAGFAAVRCSAPASIPGCWPQ